MSAPFDRSLTGEVNVEQRKKYFRQFVVWMGVYAASFLPMIILLALSEPYPLLRSLRGLVILLTLIPLVVAFRAFVLSLGTLDELQRRIQLEAFAFSLGCTAILTFTSGLFEAFLDAAHVSLIMVLPMAVFFWVAGGALARRRYE